MRLVGGWRLCWGVGGAGGDLQDSAKVISELPSAAGVVGVAGVGSAWGRGRGLLAR